MPPFKVTKPSMAKKGGQKTIYELFGQKPKATKKPLQDTVNTTINDTAETAPKSTAKAASLIKPHPAPLVSSLAQFDRAAWEATLPKETKDLLKLELENISPQWLSLVYQELTKKYFLDLKRFLLREQQVNKKTIFPLAPDIYSFTQYCPELSKIKVLVLGQDPYHNHNQAHGLAFLVRNDKLPPSLRNIYKAIAIDYPDYTPPKRNGNLSAWAEQGVLLLNTCLTVEAHKANSHNNKGWETFTSTLIANLINYKNAVLGEEVVVLAWGAFAINMVKKTINVEGINRKNGKLNRVLTSVHPSPLSAARGFFQCHHFKLCNDWIAEKYGKEKMIDWCCIKDE